MQQQIFGCPSSVGPLPLDDLTITAKNVNGNLELWVANQKDANDPLNGKYYSAPAANITSLTIRGTEDNETIIIEGPLGTDPDPDKTVNIPVTIVGRGGDDTVRINRIDGPGAEDFHGTIEVDGGAGVNKLYVDDTLSTTNNTYTVTAASVTRAGRPPIEYAAISTLGLNAGSGTNVVSIDGVPATLKLELAGGPGRDKLVMVAGHANDPTLSGFEDLVISGGKLTLNTTALAVETMTQSGGTLEGTADVSASKSLAWSGGTMQGAGKTVSLNTSTLTLSGSSTLSGRTLENHGTGNWNAATIAGGTGTLRNTGYLSGTGTLAGKLVNDGSLLPAGAGPVGTITVQGAFESAGTFAADLGATADQVAAQTVRLGGTLSPTSVAGFPARSYTVVSNTGQNPVNGTFAGLPEGTVLVISGARYRITYVGGDGNDVVLKAITTVGNYVWEDRSVIVEHTPPPWTGDGIQGTGNEYPMRNVVVRLLDDQGGLLATTTTDQNGYYEFADLDAGTYQVQFVLPAPHPLDSRAPVPWVHYEFTTRHASYNGQPAPTMDSDADSNGYTQTFTLSHGQSETSIDAGLVSLIHYSPPPPSAPMQGLASAASEDLAAGSDEGAATGHAASLPTATRRGRQAVGGWPGSAGGDAAVGPRWMAAMAWRRVGIDPFGLWDGRTDDPLSPDPYTSAAYVG